MNKAQAAALLLAGATVGVGGKTALEGVFGRAEAAPAAPIAHALDLRRDYSGENFKFTAYASRSLGDAGYVDLGQAKKCRALSDATKKQLLSCMNALGTVCEW